MRDRKAEQHAARVEAIRRLGECVIQHEQRGDQEQANLFRELLVEAQDRLRAAPKFVVVGDHQPEPRVTDEMRAGFGWKGSRHAS